MVRHRSGSHGTIDLKWFASSHNPWRKNQISEPECVISMQMCEEGDLQIGWFQSFDSFVTCCGRAPDDSRPEVDQVGITVSHNRCARTRALWVRQRSSGAQENNLGPRGLIFGQ